MGCIFANPRKRETRFRDMDRLSDLPDDVILKIVSSIPIKEAVGTCILSTRWKDLFTSIYDIDLDAQCRKDKATRFVENKSLIGSFINFVDGFLSWRKDLGVDRFRLNCRDGIDACRIIGWIRYALGHGVRELDLSIRIRNEKFDELQLLLQIGVFDCKTLETLRSSVLPRSVLSVPENCCLLNLKVLELSHLIFLDNKSIQRLISSCVSLEELLIRSCNLGNLNKLSVSHPKLKRLSLNSCMDCSGYELEINTPNLVYLGLDFFYSDVKRCSFINVNPLSEARICIGFNLESYHGYSEDISPAIDLMRGINHVQSLHLVGDSLEVKAILRTRRLIPKFPNLTYLNLCRCYPGWENMIACCPCLETLTISSIWVPIENLRLGSRRKDNVACCSVHYMIKAIKLFAYKGKKVSYELVNRVNAIKLFAREGQVEFKLVKYRFEDIEVLGQLKVELEIERKMNADGLKNLVLLSKFVRLLVEY